MHEPDKLDLLIDSAAASYAEPPAGLEDRVLHALTSVRAAKKSWTDRPRILRGPWLPWAIALSAAACLLLILFIRAGGAHRETQAQNPASTQPSQQIATPQVVSENSIIPSSARLPTPRRKHLAPPLQATAPPKLEVFPTPQPLTPQEQALVAYTARSSAPKLQALIAAQSQPEAPLRFAAIHILPIEPPDEGNK